jgi:O-antigen ligase
MNWLLRLAPLFQAIAFACVPLFPSFITLTTVAFPGISIVPHPLAYVVLALMLVLAVGATASVMLPPRRRPVLLTPLLAWWGACVLALIFGANARDGSVFVAILALSIVWHATIDRFYDAAGVARAIWWTYVISGILACAAAIAMVVTRMPAAQYAIANGRAVGTFVLPGELAGYLLFLIPVSYGLAQTVRSRPLRALSWIACVLGAVAMILTFSRTGWIGLAVGIALLVVLRARTGTARFAQGAAIVVAALAVVLMLFNEHHNPSENYTRIAIWQAAIGMIDRFPLTGVGPFGFSKIYPLVRLPGGDPVAFHAHSMYLTFFAETGLFGFLTLCWVIAAAAIAWYRRVHAAPHDATLLATAIAAGVAGALVQGLIDTVSVVIFGLLLPMLALALASARSGACDT